MINIQGTNVEVTEALKECVEHNALKLEKYDTKHNLNLKVNLTMNSKNDFECHVISKDFSTESVSSDMYVAIGDAFDKAETVLDKKKGKALSKRYESVDSTETEE